MRTRTTPQRGRPIALAAASALLAASLLAAGVARGSDEAPMPAVAEVAKSPEQIEHYWTPKRIRKAEPLLPVEAGKPSLVEPADARGSPGSVAARPASAGYVRAQAGSNTRFPERVHGRVYFTVPGEGDFACSGTVISSGRRNLVFTAGHCVYDVDTGQFATNWLFLPAYRDGDTPFGTWAATRLASTPRWIASGDARYDVGAAVVETTAGGTSVQDVVGARGIRWSQPRNQLFRSFGYPAAGPPEFTGERLFRCDSQWKGDDSSFSSPRPMAMGCDMTAGSSGGGWVIDGKFVNGVNSYYYNDPLELIDDGFNESELLFSPYFGDAVATLYESVAPTRHCRGRVATHLGSGAGDFLRGTAGADVFKTGRGRDRIKGRGGRDTTCAGPGNDVVRGGRGRDRIFGGSGRDRIFGGRGFDRCFGGRGFDVAHGCEVLKKIP